MRIAAPIAAAALGWLAAAPAAASQPSPLANWPKLMDDLKAAGAAADAKLPPGLTAHDQAEAAIMKLGALMAHYLITVHADPDHPIFRPYHSLYFNFWEPNADTLYQQARIDGAGVYRIRGEGGDIPILNLSVRNAYGQGGNPAAVPLADYDLVKHRKGAKGEIDVMLSATRPAGYAGDWLYLDPRADSFALRIVSDDWGRQTDPRLSIERLDRPSRKSRPTATELNAALEAIPAMVSRSVGAYADHVTQFRKAFGVNVLKESDYTNIGVLTGQRVYKMSWEFGPDEALILESDMPKCRYWSVLLADTLYATLDWVNNQASLNRSQARLDSDGRLRVVIAHSDPGAPNWLDTVGRPNGGLAWRWLGCGSLPKPTVKRVPLAQVSRHLPADTPVVTPAQRDQILRERRAMAQMRRQW